MISFEQCKAIFVENSLEYSREIHEKFKIYCNFMVEYNKKCEILLRLPSQRKYGLSILPIVFC